jgi:hypothetical protein
VIGVDTANVVEEFEDKNNGRASAKMTSVARDRRGLQAVAPRGIEFLPIS